MPYERFDRLCAGMIVLSLAVAVGCPGRTMAQTVSLTPASMPRIGSVEERYQSYNIEMLEVTSWPSRGPKTQAAVSQATRNLSRLRGDRIDIGNFICLMWRSSWRSPSAAGHGAWSIH